MRFNEYVPTFFAEFHGAPGDEIPARADSALESFYVPQGQYSFVFGGFKRKIVIRPRFFRRDERRKRKNENEREIRRRFYGYG